MSGWILKEADGKTVHEHSGSAGTFMCYVSIDPESKSGVVIAGNSGSLELEGIFRAIGKEYNGRQTQ